MKIKVGQKGEEAQKLEEKKLEFILIKTCVVATKTEQGRT